MKCPKIYKAKTIDDRTLVIEFTNQEIKKYDVSHLLENSMFAPLRQPAFFKNFRIDPGGYGILWNEDMCFFFSFFSYLFLSSSNPLPWMFLSHAYIMSSMGCF